MSAAAGSFTHGASGYRNYRCRCPVCTEMHRQQHHAECEARRSRTQDNGGVAPVATHNAGTYANWGCRCRACSDANAALCRQHRDRLRERAS